MLASTSHQTSAVARLSQLSLPGHVHLGVAVSEPISRLPNGLGRVDTLLAGGWPRGRVSELLGPLSCGKTSLALTLLSTITRRGEVVACIDLTDALHPESVAAAGADLQRLLWVRPPTVTDGFRCTELLLHAGGFAVIVLDLGMTVAHPLRRHIWPRLQRAAEQSHTALLILAAQRIAGSFAVLSLRLQQRAPRWRDSACPLFAGFDSLAHVERNKLGPPGNHVVFRVCDAGLSTASFFAGTGSSDAHGSR